MTSERLTTAGSLFQYKKPSVDKPTDLSLKNAPETVFPQEWKHLDFKREIFDHLMEIFFVKGEAPLPEIIADMEKSILLRALDQFNGNLKDTARFLGIKYTTLHQKMKKFNICFRKQPFAE